MMAERGEKPACVARSITTPREINLGVAGVGDPGDCDDAMDPTAMAGARRRFSFHFSDPHFSDIRCCRWPSKTTLVRKMGSEK
jgi:hypothetical protein